MNLPSERGALLARGVAFGGLTTWPGLSVFICAVCSVYLQCCLQYSALLDVLRPEALRLKFNCTVVYDQVLSGSMELPLLSLVVMVARGRRVMGRRCPSFSVSAAPLEERRMSSSSLPRAAAKAKDYATHAATQSLIKRSRSCCSTIITKRERRSDVCIPVRTSQRALQIGQSMPGRLDGRIIVGFGMGQAC